MPEIPYHKSRLSLTFLHNVVVTDAYWLRRPGSGRYSFLVLELAGRDTLYLKCHDDEDSLEFFESVEEGRLPEEGPPSPCEYLKNFLIEHRWVVLDPIILL